MQFSKETLDKVITMPNGQEVADSQGQAGEKLTIRKACMHALFMSFPGEDLKGKDKYERAALAMLVHDSPSLTLTVEQIGQIKAAVAKMYGALVVYHVWNALDPAEGESAK